MSYALSMSRIVRQWSLSWLLVWLLGLQPTGGGRRARLSPSSSCSRTVVRLNFMTPGRNVLRRELARRLPIQRTEHGLTRIAQNQ
jgi:hypothetical protein